MYNIEDNNPNTNSLQQGTHNALVKISMREREVEREVEVERERERGAEFKTYFNHD